MRHEKSIRHSRHKLHTETQYIRDSLLSITIYIAYSGGTEWFFVDIFGVLLQLVIFSSLFHQRLADYSLPI
ncbi:hypothetical protein EMIT0P74_120104 [Pseudomonas sp. IT-P74]